jgi:protein involved in ribonucleotide reduction
MIAQLHQGEMVVPQNFAQGLRDGSGLGGGDNYTININAIDTQTGVQFLKNNASQIAGIISSQVRNFNSKIPAWKS